MQIILVLFSTACLSYFLVSAATVNLLAAGAAQGVVIDDLTGASDNRHVVIHGMPPPVPAVVIENKPVTLVPVASIPSPGIVGKLTRLLGGIADVIGAKVKAVGDFFHGPPNLVLVNIPITPKPSTTKKPIVIEILGVHHKVYPFQAPAPAPVVVEDCGNNIKCTYSYS